MAISTDGQTEKDSVSTEVNVDANTNADADITAQPDSEAEQNPVDEGAASDDDPSESGDTVSPEDIEQVESDLLEEQTGDADTEEIVAPIKAETAESSGTSTEESSDIEDSEFEDIPEQPEPVRTEEVHALLGEMEIAEKEEPKIVLAEEPEDAEDQEEPSADGVNDEDYEDGQYNAASAVPSNDLPDIRIMPDVIVEPENAAAERPSDNSEFKKILESLQDSLDITQYVSSKVGAISSDTDLLKKQVEHISINSQLLTAEMESFTSSVNTKNMLSKTFLIISSSALTFLIIFQIYMFISQLKTQQLLNAAGSTVLQNISGLNKKMAEYDKNLAKAVENQAKQEHAQPNPAAEEKKGHETVVNKEAGPANVTPVAEKLNKLRNGLTERKLIRKETGDWFVFNNSKSEEFITDVEVIEVLNLAYRRIGRSLSTKMPMPSNNALCILKPDGKGGTEVVMTKDFLPENDSKPEPKKKKK